MRRSVVTLAACALFAACLGAANADDQAAAAPAAESAAPVLPAQPADLIAYVTRALNTRDIDAFDRLVEWQGARPIRRRMTLYQIRYNFGRPIKSASIEDFPVLGLREARRELNLRPNLPVTERLRVVFDEPSGPDGEIPTSVFLLGKENGVYRISLLLASGPPK